MCLTMGLACAQAGPSTIDYSAEQQCLVTPGEKRCIAKMQAPASTLASLNGKTLVVGGKAFSEQEHQLVLLMTQSDSRPAAQGRGFCGAGEELAVSLWLLDFPKKLARQVDAMKLASCLYSIEIADAPADLRANLAMANPQRWWIEWANHADHGPGKHSVSVRGLTLVVE